MSTLYLFKQIMAEEKSLPKEQPYKDLVALINYILRKFFKAVAEDSFLVVEVSFSPDMQAMLRYLIPDSSSTRRSSQRTEGIGNSSRAPSSTKSALVRRSYLSTVASLRMYKSRRAIR